MRHKPCAPSQSPSTTSSVSLGWGLILAQLSLHFWTSMKCHSGTREIEVKGVDTSPSPPTLPSADGSEVCFLRACLLVFWRGPCVRPAVSLCSSLGSSIQQGMPCILVTAGFHLRCCPAALGRHLPRSVSSLILTLSHAFQSTFTTNVHRQDKN